MTELKFVTFTAPPKTQYLKCSRRVRVELTSALMKYLSRENLHPDCYENARHMLTCQLDGKDWTRDELDSFDFHWRSNRSRRLPITIQECVTPESRKGIRFDNLVGDRPLDVRRVLEDAARDARVSIDEFADRHKIVLSDRHEDAPNSDTDIDKESDSPTIGEVLIDRMDRLQLQIEKLLERLNLVFAELSKHQSNPPPPTPHKQSAALLRLKERVRPPV